MSIPPLEMRQVLSNTAKDRQPSEAKSSHPVTKMKIAGSDSIWYSKKMTYRNPRDKWLEEQESRIECLAQEFFRLIIPNQPEVRLLADTSATPPSFYVLSEEVSGFHNLPYGESFHFADGVYTGLGQATTLAMFLQEIDLKNGNIGLDGHGHVIKIDGDWCFANHRISSSRVPLIEYKLTEKAIASLPYPEDFYAFNWLDLIQNDVLIASPRNPIAERSLANTKQFRNEVNQALLKLCLLPDEYIDRFVLAFIADKGQRFADNYAPHDQSGLKKPGLSLSDLIKSRREELKASALLNGKFQEYLATPAAIADAEDLITQLLSFRSNGVPLEATPKDVANIHSTFRGLLEGATPRIVSASSEEASPSTTPKSFERPMKMAKTSERFFVPLTPETLETPTGSTGTRTSNADKERTHLKPGELK